MALNIKDKEAEALVNEIASLTGETTTAAVRQAAKERLGRLKRAEIEGRLGGDPRRDAVAMRRFFETEIWPLIPEEHRGKTLTKAEREELLGYGPGGV